MIKITDKLFIIIAFTSSVGKLTLVVPVIYFGTIAARIAFQFAVIKCVDSGIKRETDEISIGELLSLAAIHLDVRADTVQKVPIVRELQ